MSEIRDALDNRGISKAELMEVADEMAEVLSFKGLLDDIMKALDSDTLRDTLAYIARQWDL